MRFTNAELLNMKEPLSRLVKMKLPVRTSLAIIQLAKKIAEYLGPVEQVREGLINQYGSVKKGEKGKSVLPTDENWKAFMEDYSELISQEVEIVLTPVMLPSAFEVEPEVLMPLEKVIGIEA